ncbi:MAG: hypothetical protein PHT02_00930 [Tissierellia bacterium]|nr:hypothetical protein [Tissierellia bacterium]
MLDNKTLSTEQLIMKSEGVRDCAKWIEKKIKEEKKQLEKEEKEYLGYIFDEKDFYKRMVDERKARIEVLIESKISLEKYMKLLMHMSEEVSTNC